MAHRTDSGLLRIILPIWRRLPQRLRWNLEDTFKPEDVTERLLPGEVVQREVHMAWYRDIIGTIVFDYFNWLLLATLLSTIGFLAFGLIRGISLWLAGIPILVLTVFTIWGIRDRIEHSQWRILKTNTRFIISIPVHNSWPLVDNVELKGSPAVLDGNWSSNPFWRVFQFFTGARDLSISLVGYAFDQNTAKVKNAITMPDIMPEDLFELKRLVFAPPKPSSGPPAPQRVVFAEPQKVIISGEDQGEDQPQ